MKSCENAAFTLLAMVNPIVAETLLQLLVCPVCRAGLTAGPESTTHRWLRCTACLRYYPVQDGIPVMLEDRASTLPPQ